MLSGQNLVTNIPDNEGSLIFYSLAPFGSICKKSHRVAPMLIFEKKMQIRLATKNESGSTRVLVGSYGDFNRIVGGSKYGPMRVLVGFELALNLKQDVPK